MHAMPSKTQRVEDAVEQFESPLVRFCARITGDPEEARDIVQEAFVSLVEALDGVPEQDTGAWLYKCCYNRSITVLRKRGRRRCCDADVALQTTPSDEPSPAEEAAAQDDRASVLRVLNRLPPEQKAVVQLRLDGFKYSEIAEIMNKPTPTVGYLLHVAIKTLRNQFRRPTLENQQAMKEKHETREQ